MQTISRTLTINATPQKVYAAIATQKGIHAWWTDNADVDEQEGGKATFRFVKHEVEKDVEIKSLKPAEQVTWYCYAHRCQHPDWVGTTIDFSLKAAGERTVLQFTHRNWQDDAQIFDVCVDGWNYFTDSLKQYCETGSGTPELN